MDTKWGIVAQNIKAAREHLAWTQAQLAEAAGLTDRTIQRAEAGEPVQAESLQAIAGALDIPVELLRVDMEELAAKLQAEAEEIDRKYVRTELQLLETGSEFRYLLPVDAFQLDWVNGLSAEQEEAIARLQDLLKDYIDVWRDIESSHHLDAFRTIGQEIARLKTLGLSVTAGVERVRLKLQDGGAPLSWRVLHVVVSTASQPQLFHLRERNAEVDFVL
jgi:transcriptional regulator with XRE-family HTH domain